METMLNGYQLKHHMRVVCHGSYNQTLELLILNNDALVVTKTGNSVVNNRPYQYSIFR